MSNKAVVIIILSVAGVLALATLSRLDFTAMLEKSFQFASKLPNLDLSTPPLEDGKVTQTHTALEEAENFISLGYALQAEGVYIGPTYDTAAHRISEALRKLIESDSDKYSGLTIAEINEILGNKVRGLGYCNLTSEGPNETHEVAYAFIRPDGSGEVSGWTLAKRNQCVYPAPNTAGWAEVWMYSRNVRTRTPVLVGDKRKFCVNLEADFKSFVDAACNGANEKLVGFEKYEELQFSNENQSAGFDIF